MLSIRQYKIIEEQLSSETASEFVKTLISKYANSVDTIGELLSYIPKIAEKQLQIKQKRINQYSFGMDLMIADRHIHLERYNKNDANNRFVMLFYVCKAHFVNGNSEHCSVSGKAFFEEFIEILQAKKGFDYTSEKDWEWVYTTAGGADWLESVIRQNIDSEFVKPKNAKPTCRTYEQIW